MPKSKHRRKGDKRPVKRSGRHENFGTPEYAQKIAKIPEDA